MKILITEQEDYSENALNQYRTIGDVITLNTKERSELLEKVGDVDVVVGRLAFNFDEEFFQAAKNLKAIGTPTTGLDHINTTIAQQKNVAILSLKGEMEFLMNIQATPEHTLLLLLAALRKLPAAHNHAASGLWNRDLFKGREIKGQTIGFYGFGRVARLVTKFVTALGAHVIAFDPYQSHETITQQGARVVSRDELFSQSSVIMITCALNDETKNSVGAKEFALMRDGVFFINTARGQIVDEKELLKNLENKKITGAALDVLADERETNEVKNPLIAYAATHDNLIITPHIAGATYDSMHATEDFIAHKVVKFFAPKNEAPKEIHPNHNEHFNHQWIEAISKQKGQEFSLFVPQHENPKTQRQFNLFNYFSYIQKEIEGKGYSSSLELGAGRGTISLYLKKYLGFTVTLNDMSDEAMALAKANFTHFKEEAQFVVSDARALPFADNSFDVVTSIGLMEHLDDYAPILKEAYRVLKPGGTMIQINIPQKNSIQLLNVGYRKILQLLGKELRKDFPRNTDTPEMYAMHAREAGFHDVKTINVNPFPLFVPIPMVVDETLAILYRGILKVRGLFFKEPFTCSYELSQCHFLIGKK